MASPAYRSNSQNFVFTGTNTVTTGDGSDPAGAANNDALLMVVHIDATGATGSTPGTITHPPGWTLEDSVVQGPVVDLLYSIRRGSSAPSFAVSWVNACIYSETTVIAMSGARTSGSVVDSFARATGTSTQPDPPSDTILTVDTLAVVAASHSVGWTSAATPPTGYTNRLSGGTFTGAFATKTVAVTGAENPSAFSAADSSAAWVAWTVAVASVAAGVAGVVVQPRQPRDERMPEERLQRRAALVSAGTAPAAYVLGLPRQIRDERQAEELPRPRGRFSLVSAGTQAPAAFVLARRWQTFDERPAPDVPPLRLRGLPSTDPGLAFWYAQVPEEALREELPQRRRGVVSAGTAPAAFVLALRRQLVEVAPREELPRRPQAAPLAPPVGTDGVCNAFYDAWSAAGTASEATAGTCAGLYDAWTAAGSGAETCTLTGLALYSAWSASGTASESHALTGAAFYDAWFATGFDVAPIANLTAWHGINGPTMLQ